jgi:exodeoxyribonuclease-3
MKLISWNVNGIRAVLKKGFHDFVDKERPDIICIQETKAHPDQVDEIMHDYEHHYWNSAEKKGYSGTAIFSKIKPIAVTYGDGPMNDTEGRTITLEFEEYFLINVYTPNSKRELERLEGRQKWDKDFLKFIKNIEKKKPVIVCGDLNCAHKEIDIARPKQNERTAGFTIEERRGMDNYLNNGLVDTFREFNSEPDNYTYWSYMFNARANNVGWRIDYFLISKKIRSILKDAFILNKVMGSDHCPVGIILKN